MKTEQMIEKLRDVFDWIEGNHPDCKYDPLDSLREVLDALSSPCACRGRKPLFRFSHIDLVYNPDDGRHWLKLGLLLERGSEDINDCDLLIMPEGTIAWDVLPAEETV